MKDHAGSGSSLELESADSEDKHVTSSGLRRCCAPWLLVATTLIAVMAIVSCVLIVAASGSSNPGTGSAEAGFARDMQIHHAQAVEMSMIVRDRTEGSEVRALAFDIALTQQQQQGQMFDWLVQWDLPQARSGPPMAWMNSDHSMPGTHPGMNESGEMAGLAAHADIEALKMATGIQAEVLYLRLMIAHHRGGIEMVDGVLARSDNESVNRLATAMRAAQQTEIDQMLSMLAIRGSEPTQ